jgi:hypothetical protein
MPDRGHASSASQRRTPWRAIAAAVGVVVLGGAVYLTVSVRRAITDAMCRENLYMIAHAVDAYADGHGGACPDSFASLLMDGNLPAACLADRRRGDTTATGPTTRAVIEGLARPGHLSYVYVGGGLTTATVTDDTLVAFQTPSADGGTADALLGRDDVESLDAATAARLAKAVASSTTRPIKCQLPPRR